MDINESQKQEVEGRLIALHNLEPYAVVLCVPILSHIVKESALIYHRS
jgi:hypothetical protein